MPRRKDSLEGEEEGELQDETTGEDGSAVVEEQSSGSSTEEAIDVEEIDGVGKVTAQKLREAGFMSARDVAYASIRDLLGVVGSEDRAKQIIQSAQRLIGLKSFVTAFEVYENRRSVKYISTGVKALDELLGGAA